MREVLITFYGLENMKPIYNYKLTAEILGMSQDAVKTAISKANRLLFGSSDASRAKGNEAAFFEEN